jgi:hypothetical protein
MTLGTHVGGSKYSEVGVGLYWTVIGSWTTRYFVKTRHTAAGIIAILIFLALLTTSSASAQGGPPFRTDDPDTPGDGNVEINFGWIGDRNPAHGAYQVPDVDMNYGVGSRIQLKYELPIAISESRAIAPSAAFPSGQEGIVLGDLGESLLGIKFRYYEHHAGDPIFGHPRGFWFRGDPAEKAGGDADGGSEEEKPPKFELGTYPQLYLNNPTRAVARGVVANGPDFYLPIEISGRIGPIRYNADFGYNFGNRSLPQSWNRGFVIGHEFSESTEAYLELYDYQDANRLPGGRGIGQFASGGSKSRETTIGLGGRQSLNKAKSLNLLLMAGRSFQTVSAANSQPSWIAYVGIQVLGSLKHHKADTVSEDLNEK